MNLLITNGRIIDPSNRRDGLFDLLIQNGKISKISKKIHPQKNDLTVSAKGCWILPGLIDVHVHLREPGGEESETIETGSRAAAAGGVTSLLAMPNTQPPIDTPRQVQFVVKRAKETAIVKIYPVGAITKGQEGKELADIHSMVKEGCVAISDDGHCVMNSQLLRWALDYCKSLGITLIEHCEDENRSRGGVMYEGALSIKLGLKGIPEESESNMIARDIFLAQLTGARLHCAHVSCADSVELIRRAKKKGIRVTAETCPHYFSLTENAVQRYNTLAKVKPPLRTEKDVEAIKKGLADGTIDIIASDHAPHASYNKEKEFSRAPFGMIGLETLFSLTYNELVLKKVLSVQEAVRKMTQTPAELFSLQGGNLSVGSAADVTIFNPKKIWIVSAKDFASKSSNSPFIGKKLKGKIVTTIVDGKIVFQKGAFPYSHSNQ